MMIKRAVRLAGPAGLTAMLLAVPACDTIGSPLEMLGAAIPPPDEFQVIAHKPLVIPATVALPEPRPGAPSPLDPDPHRDAQRALFGTSDSSVVGAIEPSAGEKVLLSSANAAATSGEITVQLEQDRTREAAAKPYEPPSLVELLGWGGGEEKLDEAELLDPVAESQRLQREGYLTPVDPNAAADAGEAKAPHIDEILEYPTNRPQSPIKAEGAAPAY
ncbi:MAG: DUF3035 domain-containing protein [Alphaproteobacteria bacterium]